MTSLTAANDWVTVPEEGDALFRWRRATDGVVAEWIDILTLRVKPSGDIECTPAPGADPLLAQKIAGTNVLAFLRMLRGESSLHGSAVARAGAAVVCLGEGGAGKSTAASELCTSSGFELFADDVVAFELLNDRWHVLPTESAHWLGTGDSTLKEPVPARARGAAPVDLRVLAHLRFEDRAPRLAARRARGTEAYSLLASAVIRFERESAVQQRELDFLSSIASQARVYEITRPHGCPASSTAALLADLAAEVA
jgi:hypothetical protein